MPKNTAIRFSLLNVGFAADNDQWNFGPICSSFSRIYLVTKGSAFVEFGGKRHLLTPGHLYLIPAFTTHYDISHGLFEHYYIHFIDTSQLVLDLYHKYELPFEIEAEDNLETFFRDIIANFPDYALRHSLPSTYDNSSTIVRSLQDFESLPVGKRMLLNGEIHIMLAHFFMKARERMSVTDDRISKALWLIERNLAKAPSLDSLAAGALLGKERFIRLFKQQTGQTPTAYIINQKITKAQVMLSSRKYTVKEVAFGVGFDSVSYFGRQFKKVTGMSPLRFAMQNR